MFLKVYSALKEQVYLRVFYVPIYFMGLQLKFFLPVYLTAVYRTVHIDIYFKLQANQFSVVFFFFFSFSTLCGSDFFEYSYGLLLSLYLFPIALCKHNGHSKM